jgi:hypothetical protein
MYYGVSREDYNSILDKKRQQKITKDRDGKRREANAPPLDRIPLPSLSDSVKQEYRAAYRDIQLKKVRSKI